MKKIKPLTWTNKEDEDITHYSSYCLLNPDLLFLAVELKLTEEERDSLMYGLYQLEKDKCMNDIINIENKMLEVIKIVANKLDKNDNSDRCIGGCKYSKTMHQDYPRKCLVCGKEEVV